jgi:choline dehydrogenase-like flavoprotein
LTGIKRFVDGFCVGDASIMPDVPSVATNPTTTLITEIVADRMKLAGRPRWSQLTQQCPNADSRRLHQPLSTAYLSRTFASNASERASRG